MRDQSDSAASTYETHNFLRGRVREEAIAAADAISVEATMIHVALATAYAKRFGETSSSLQRDAAAWVSEHRIW